jgi:hypothetical protein
MPSVRFSSEEAASAANDSVESPGSPSPPAAAGSILRNTAGEQGAPTAQGPPRTLSGSNRLKMSFFRNIFNRRDDDYRSDQPSAPAAVRRAVSTDYRAARSNNSAASAGPNSSSGSFGEDGESPASMSRMQRFGAGMANCLRPSRAALDGVSMLISSRTWHVMLVFFTILLLFGSQFQELLVPKEGDIVFDILFTVALGVFAFDMLFRCYTEPQYFELNICGKSFGEAPAAWGSCRLGSFMFWCDLVSSLTLLWDISYVNKFLFDEATIDIQLDGFGMPVSYF